ncbi:MAG: YcxB family protein [Ruminococcus sp.]|nr:YcxB family protein [Ruminococcus sp.]
MTDKYLFEKNYSVPFEIFRDGYIEFQKKFVFPQANVTAVAFLILAGVFIFAVIDDNSQYFAYLLIFASLAMAIRQWYNPRKLRANLFESFHETENSVYKISVTENYVDISTVSTGENSENEEEDLPEKSRIPVDENFSLLEYDKYFLIFSGKIIFYIIPKENFSENETGILRNLK